MSFLRTINIVNLTIILTYAIYRLTLYSSLDDDDGEIDIDYDVDSPEIIESRGFQCETHSIVTSDGYILKVFRIVNPFKLKIINSPETLNGNPTSGKPVLLQSGLFGSSDDFLLNSPGGYIDESLLNLRESSQSINFNESGRNLGFLLANLGYDVWLTNFRGNYYSRNHTTLNPNSSEYWSTGYDEMATIDLPTTIDYVLKKTGKESVGYVGMSRGSAIMFALLSEKPEYSNKVKPFIAMAPAVFVGRARTFLRKIFNFNIVTSYFLNNPGECFSRGLIQRIKSICSTPLIDMVCSFVGRPIKLVLRVNERYNTTRLGVYFSHYPAGSPCWDIVHFNQIGVSDQFQKLDFGLSNNLVKYNQSNPPIYSLDKIQSQDIIIINSIGDKVIRFDAVEKLVNHLKVKPKEWIQINLTDFNHGNFIHSSDAGEIVYKHVARVLSSYSA